MITGTTQKHTPSPEKKGDDMVAEVDELMAEKLQVEKLLLRFHEELKGRRCDVLHYVRVAEGAMNDALDECKSTCRRLNAIMGEIEGILNLGHEGDLSDNGKPTPPTGPHTG